jgi:hypothetical protein
MRAFPPYAAPTVRHQIQQIGRRPPLAYPRTLIQGRNSQGADLRPNQCERSQLNFDVGGKKSGSLEKMPVSRETVIFG